MNWSPKAGKICCLGRFWVVAGRVRQVVLETRFILMEKHWEEFEVVFIDRWSLKPSGL